MENFACGYCGTQQIVERGGGIIRLRAISEGIRLVQRGTDKTAAELALKRLPIELENLKAEKIGTRFRYNELIKKRSNYLLGLTVGTFFCVLLLGNKVLSGIFGTFLNHDVAGTTAFMVGLLLSIAVGVAIRHYLVKNDLFGISKLEKQKSDELAGSNVHMQALEKKIRENYEVANS